MVIYNKYILLLLFQNSKYLVSKNSSSDQKYGSVRGNGTSYPSPGRGSPSRDRSYSSKSSYHSQKSHREKERDSRDYKSRNSDKYSGKFLIFHLNFNCSHLVFYLTFQIIT